MQKRNKWLYIFIIVFIAVSVSAITPAVIRNNLSFDSRTDAADGSLDNGSNDDTVFGTPRVVSVDPTVVYVGELFNYYLKIVDSDTDISEISIILLTAPDWILFDDNEMKIYGIPEIDTSDTVKIELLIDDGKNAIVHEFYLLIMERDE